MTRHKLKILPQYFEAQIKGFKNFELRKHDRDFTVSDEIELTEIDHVGFTDIKTGRTCLLRINYILSSPAQHPFEGLEEGYCILGTELLEQAA